MKTLIEKLQNHPQLSGYKLNIQNKESFELFFVKGKLETVRATDTCDQAVTVYADHDGCKGDSQFFVYASTTDEELDDLIEKAAAKALLIANENYELPGKEEGDYQVESNFRDYDPVELATTMAQTVFAANTLANGSLNSVEIFINKYHDTVINSNGLHKTQVRYDAMVEAIPTYNGERESVELYEQYNFSSLNVETLRAEIADKMEEVQARYEAVKPDFPLEGDVILNKLELENLFTSIAGDLNYATVYGHTNVFQKGDAIQEHLTGDPITITMEGESQGSVASRKFDGDGLSLRNAVIVENGKAVSYYGSNRFGQYLGETPTGNLGCCHVAPGSLDDADLKTGLEVVSMSGLQVDFYNDYVGGEVRLAYYYKDGKKIPVTGVSITGKLREVLNHIRLSKAEALHDSYVGPAKARLSCMKIF